MTPLLVFTDLDGTLLDHASYDWAPAAPALDALKELGVPVVLASSKTAAEIGPLRDEMGLGDVPAIVENGAGLLGGEAAADYPALRAALAEVPPGLRRHFKGFDDMSVSEIAQVTGLDPDGAARARMREFSEPGLWFGEEHERKAFLDALAGLGVEAREGGRFLTLSFGATKADRMAAIVERYRPEHVIALGDAANDVEMLDRADTGVIVANPGHDPLPLLEGERTGRIRRTEDAGPRGWSTAIFDILAARGLKTGG